MLIARHWAHLGRAARLLPGPVWSHCRVPRHSPHNPPSSARGPQTRVEASQPSVWASRKSLWTWGPSGAADGGWSRPGGVERHRFVFLDKQTRLVLRCGTRTLDAESAQTRPISRESQVASTAGVDETRRTDTEGQQEDCVNIYENPWTIPNVLCVARIAMAPIIGYLITYEEYESALGVFILAGATDLLDGIVARTWASQKSAMGSILDPLADKILISILYISLTCASLIPVALTTLIIARDVILIAAVFHVRYRTLTRPRRAALFFNPCYATAQLKPTLESKVNTAVQLFLVAISIAAPVFKFTESSLFPLLWFITAVTTLASGHSYYHYGRESGEASLCAPSMTSLSSKISHESFMKMRRVITDTLNKLQMAGQLIRERLVPKSFAGQSQKITGQESRTLPGHD
uniref:Cardiolipin synthase (CMP-forming) n=1 Tax=Eptatretus burgeri TaxID=7764 RepID=A0A8C4RDC0_EPTBU